MKHKRSTLLLSSLLLIGCLAGGVAEASAQADGEAISAPVFDFSRRTVMLNSGYDTILNLKDC